jgi:hypothetical protein
MVTLHTNTTGAATLNRSHVLPAASGRADTRQFDSSLSAYPLPELHPARSEHGMLEAQGVTLYTLRLRAGQRIDLSLGSSADVDIYVIDPLGQSISCDNHFGHSKECGVDVSIPGEYLVKIVNNANYRAEFRLCAHARSAGSYAVRGHA